jgi:hypothetical protein
MEPTLPLNAALLDHVVASGVKNPEETTALLVEEEFDLFAELLEVDQFSMLKELKLCKIKHQTAGKLASYCLLFRTPCNVLTNAELVANVRGLGPNFQFYALALEERGNIDGEYLEILSASQMEMILTLVPKAHQVQLEAVFKGKSQVPVEGTVALDGEGNMGSDDMSKAVEIMDEAVNREALHNVGIKGATIEVGVQLSEKASMVSRATTDNVLNAAGISASEIQMGMQELCLKSAQDAQGQVRTARVEAAMSEGWGAQLSDTETLYNEDELFLDVDGDSEDDGIPPGVVRPGEDDDIIDMQTISPQKKKKKKKNRKNRK